MGDSLYALLGVGEDADSDTIRTAYRERVKQRHPDVSDDPDATRQFKRLTVARDTLLDDDERARYDEMGHEAYLRGHSQGELFEVPRRGDAEPTAERQRAGASGSGTVAAAGVGTHEEWWHNREAPTPKQPAGARSNTREDGPAVTWARSRETGTERSGSRTHTRLKRFVHQAGGWPFFHLFLIASAVATSVFLYSSTPPKHALVALMFGIGLVTLTVAAATLHMVSVVYT